MSVPLSVFQNAGLTVDESKQLKNKFDEQEIELAHLAAGEVTQVTVPKILRKNSCSICCC